MDTSPLLRPGQIGSLELRNRIVQTAMGVNLAEPDNSCGESFVNFHEARAKGGVGLIIVGVAGVAAPDGLISSRQIGLSHDRFIPGLKRLTESIHRHGAHIAVQLHLGGLKASKDMAAGQSLWAPSAQPVRPSPLSQMMLQQEWDLSLLSRVKGPISYRVLDLTDIQAVVEKFAAAALRAKEAGFDGIEVHAAHGYLIGSFLSPTTNFRTDSYGGPIANRAQLLVEVIRAIRERVGTDFPLWCKIDGHEFHCEDGIRVADAIAVAKIIEAEGCDAVTVSSYHGTESPRALSSSNIPFEPGAMLPFAKAVKSEVSIPVICSGRIEIDRAETLIEDGSLDFVAFGRKLLADPELPRKVAEKKVHSIRPCIYCYICMSDIVLDKPIRCASNPETGREAAFALTPAKKPKKVVIVGGGPAGMEAALRLSQRGHEVMLFEAERQLGGTTRVAAIAYEPNQRLLNYLVRRITESPVRVMLNQRVSASSISTLQPDAVIIATGATRIAPEIAGREMPHVFDGDAMRELLLHGSSSKNLPPWQRGAIKAARLLGLTSRADWVRKLSHLWMPLGKNIVIIGGDLVGLELAEFLAERHRTVTVIDDQPKVGGGLSLVRRMRMIDVLTNDENVVLVPSATDIAINAKSVTCIDREGNHRAFPADQVIIAKGARPNLGLAGEIKANGIETFLIGDCRGVSFIDGATESAAAVALKI